ncbi:hypothetical protein PoB_004494800 [Plakobranchus ocellatus]|uniref:Parvovirus non-structural protein 1 helicase domain-containing protein n=1 Tax=Plakobranchus ocellatus TaxID=259542 RepID=A0AAV4BFR6_9GAST|nr:hypothetical protein PoB_004494800 [Plakobranchus ocellatus]
MTPKRYMLANSQLLQPMKPMLDREGKVKLHEKFGFPMSTLLKEEDRLEFTVNKWLTPASHMKELDATPKMLINKIKDFLNTTDVSMFHHETQKESAFCNYRKPSNLHLLIRSQQRTIRDVQKYRSLERTLKQHQCDMFARKVLTDHNKVYSYCINDDEKLFLGTNSREQLEESDRVVGTNLGPPKDDDMQVEVSSVITTGEVVPTPALCAPPMNPRKRKYMASVPDTTSQLGENTTEDYDDDPNTSKYTLTNDGKRRPKALQNLDLIKSALTLHPYCASFADLVTAVRGTALYDQVCAIYLDQRADKIWNLAKEELLRPDEDIDLYQHLHDLPDDLKHTLTPMQTLALFNAWCEEQGTNAKAIAWFLVSRLQNRAYKRIGLYLQGAPNSGKTYWSSTLFAPLGAFVGKMTTGGRFCLQDCERKKIIVGEENGIGLDNIDRIKELMSGEVTTCERKGRSVVRCKANLILLNSNNMPATNVQHERQALMNRIYLVLNLRPSTVLPAALRNMPNAKPHPKFLTLIAPPTDEELHDLDNNQLVYRYEPALTNDGMILKYQSSWKDWLLDLQHGPLQLDELDKNIQMDWFLGQSPEEHPRGYLNQQQVRRLKAIPQRRREGPPNLAKAIRNVGPYNLPPLPPADHFSDSDADSDVYNIPSLPSTTDSLDSDTDSFVTAQENLQADDDYIVASPPQPRASRGETDTSTSTDPPTQEEIAGPSTSDSPTDVHSRTKRSALATKRGSTGVSGASPPTSARFEEAAEEAMEEDAKKGRRHGHHKQLGSNNFFDGWGEWTSPEGQHFTTLQKGYAKNFKAYCTFECTKKAIANLKSVNAEADEITVTINHGGHTLPYWKRNASICDDDFNQPNNVIGFRCINMGFRVPRLEISTCPEDRTTDHEMPMNPPMQTEMWTFTDIRGDYGVPQLHDPDHANC